MAAVDNQACCRIMFDEEGERLLRETDLLQRLYAALDGPNAWLNWSVARALARNLVVKLEDPPQRQQRVLGWRRAWQDVDVVLRWMRGEAALEDSGYFDGNRLEDTQVLATS